MTTIDDDLRSRLTALTRDLILIPSTDSRPTERARCFEFIQNHLDPLEGVRFNVYESNGYESLLATSDVAADPDILLCGHIDVIDHPQPNCYHSKICDGRIYGPGAGDMKGADAILIELFRDLHRRYPQLALGLLLTSDEERGGSDGVRFLFEEVGIRCGLAIIPDGGSLNEVTVEEKGVLQTRIRQLGHEAHGARPWLGVNAVELLLDRLKLLREHFASYWPEGPVIEQQNHWFPTCSITMLGTPNETPNRIPSEAEAVVDIRFPPPFTVESMTAEISHVLGHGIELIPNMSAETTHLDPDPLFCQITEEITGNPAVHVKSSGASDSRFFRQHEIPVNLSRPIVGNLHAVDEWIDIDSMVSYYKICEAYIARKLVPAS